MTTAIQNLSFLLWLFATCCVAQSPIESLKKYLAAEASERGELHKQPFANAVLTKEQASTASRLLADDFAERLRKERAAEMKAGAITIGDKKMRFAYRVFGEAPKSGRSLFISLHGGGGAPARVNDSQWENQKRLYAPKEGVYVAPRAPTDTWNLWHQSHIDGLFDRLIENMIMFEGVDPNRVYVMGYSAGGDGVYQLAPRMADRWAAAAMMAGHPNDASADGLRNIGFALYCGGRDSAYDRNKIAAQWGDKLAALQNEDPAGYRHRVKIYPDKGHWMDREDREALPWMAKFTRDPFPNVIRWKQDDVTQSRFYYLAVDDANRKKGAIVTAVQKDQTITIKSETVSVIEVRLSDKLIDLDQPVTIKSGDKKMFQGKLKRTIANIDLSLGERFDPASIFTARVKVEL